MRIRQYARVVLHETNAEKFERITKVSISIKDRLLLSPDLDVVDLWTEFEPKSEQLNEEQVIVRSL